MAKLADLLNTKSINQMDQISKSLPVYDTSKGRIIFDGIDKLKEAIIPGMKIIFNSKRSFLKAIQIEDKSYVPRVRKGELVLLDRNNKKSLTLLNFIEEYEHIQHQE